MNIQLVKTYKVFRMVSVMEEVLCASDYYIIILWLLSSLPFSFSLSLSFFN